MCLIVVAVVVLLLLLLPDFDKECTDAESDKAWRCSVKAKLYITIIRNLEKNSDEYKDNSSKSSSSSSLVFILVADVAVVDREGKLSGGITTGSWKTKYFGFRAKGEEDLHFCFLAAIILCLYDADTSGEDVIISGNTDTTDTSFIVSVVLVIVVSSSVSSSSSSIIVLLLLFTKLILNGTVLLLVVVVSVVSLSLSLLLSLSSFCCCCCCSRMAAKGFNIFNTEVNDFTAASY
mmetsp:Transcript_53206/g.57748  ORF Transcript_53206/g.57748 Transcript_53206/m.57748 type:complete len:234 (+) Transcript_53206:509-1210(+)